MSVVASVIAALSSRVSSVVPPDRPRVPYHALGGKRAAQTSTSSARGFVFSEPSVLSIEIENDEVRLTRWCFELFVVLDNTGRGVDAVPGASADETQAIHAAVDSMTPLPAGCHVVVVTESGTIASEDPESPSTDTLLRLAIEADCWEISTAEVAA